MRYVVMYRTGGTDDCRWTLMTPRYPLADAKMAMEDITRMGYKAIMRSEEDFKVTGMPIGWEAGLVDWERDEIRAGEGWTQHRRVFDK